MSNITNKLSTDDVVVSTEIKDIKLVATTITLSPQNAPLHVACRDGDVELVKIFIRQKNDLGKKCFGAAHEMMAFYLVPPSKSGFLNLWDFEVNAR